MRACPANFFLANPDLIGGADLTTNVGKSDYHALQLELRRRLSQGLQFSANYAFGNQQVHSWQTFRRDVFMIRDSGDPGDITHVFKMGAALRSAVRPGPPVRRQRQRLRQSHHRRLVGQPGLARPERTSRRSGQRSRRGHDRGRCPGLLQAAVRRRRQEGVDAAAGRHRQHHPGVQRERDVCDRVRRPADLRPADTSRRPTDRTASRSTTAPTYGDCGTRSLVVTGPMFQMHDFSVAKRVTVVGRTNVEFRFEMLNVFNNANFVPTVSGSATPRLDPQQLRGHRTHRREHRARDSARYTVQLVEALRQAGRVAQPGRLLTAGSRRRRRCSSHLDSRRTGNFDDGSNQRSLPSLPVPTGDKTPF